MTPAIDRATVEVDIALASLDRALVDRWPEASTRRLELLLLVLDLLRRHRHKVTHLGFTAGPAEPQTKGKRL